MSVLAVIFDFDDTLLPDSTSALQSPQSRPSRTFLQPAESRASTTPSIVPMRNSGSYLEQPCRIVLRTAQAI